MSLTAGEILQMRATVDDALPSAAVILRRTDASDGQGGYTQSFAAVGTVDCRLSPRSGGEAGGEEIHGDRMAYVSEWILTTPALTDIRPTDRVTVDGDRTYEVNALRARRSWELSTTVRVSEVD